MQHCQRIKIPHKLPSVLSREEVERMIDGIRNLKHRAMVALLYSSGMRLNECAKLKPADIDSDRMTIRVEAGKGQKDRYAVLSPRALNILNEYRATHFASDWLFPGRRSHISGRSIQYVVAYATVNAGIRKRVHPHTLRHSFATHLIEAGVPLQIIQLFLGHENLKTTAEYAHISSTMISGVSSPFDMPLASAAGVRHE